MISNVNPPSDLVDLCLLRIEMDLLRDELDRAAPRSPASDVPSPGIDSASFRLRGPRLDCATPARGTVSADTAARVVQRVSGENRALRDRNAELRGELSVWRVFALAAGSILLFVLWHASSN